MDGLLSQETTSTGQASTGSRGITPLPTVVPKGHLVFRTRSCESEVLETHLAAIPECLSDLKTRFEEFNEEAGSAVRNSDWTATCQSYEEWRTALGEVLQVCR
ncbi:unnamed protein product [Sphagnum compactum]